MRIRRAQLATLDGPGESPEASRSEIRGSPRGARRSEEAERGGDALGASRWRTGPRSGPVARGCSPASDSQDLLHHIIRVTPDGGRFVFWGMTSVIPEKMNARRDEARIGARPVSTTVTEAWTGALSVVFGPNPPGDGDVRATAIPGRRVNANSGAGGTSSSRREGMCLSLDTVP